MYKKIITLVFASLLLSACGKATTSKITPTPAPKLVEMPVSERPYISMVPRDDGHMIYLKISKISKDINAIEYEVLYTAVDGTSEIEKGLGDTIKEVTENIERKLLLGTESCTNGCKYKFDEGVSGGTITLSFINKNGQISTFESPFVLKSSASLKKEGELKLSTENFSVKPKSKITGSDFFILQKNYQGGYSVFSNGNNSIVGDYPQP
jgi:hypothetical protein